MKKLLLYILIILSIVFTGNSCMLKEDVKPDLSTGDSVYIFVDEIMKYWYLWNDRLPQLDYTEYNTPEKFLDDLKYDEYDHWSFIGKASDVEKLFAEGTYFGFGFYLARDSEDKLWAFLSYPQSDAYKAGITRGTRITKMNGTMIQNIESFDFFFDDSPQQVEFEFINSMGNAVKTTISKREVKMDGILFSNIYTVSGKKTGYFVYDSFLGYTEKDLKATLKSFKDNNIDELIIDLRYNGGGYVSICELLGEAIIPQNVVGEVYYTSYHNKQRASENDDTYWFKYSEYNLNLKRVFFITTDNSASASELLINSLKPHMEVITIGEPSRGKPVGMYGFKFQDWEIYPVTNQIKNADGFGEYFDGLPVDKSEIDGKKYPWGDETEPCLNQAFHYISYGSFDNTTIALKSASQEIVAKSLFQKPALLIRNR